MLLSLLTVFSMEKVEAMSYLSNLGNTLGITKKEEPKSWSDWIIGNKKPEPTALDSLVNIGKEGIKYIGKEGATSILSGDPTKIAASTMNFIGQDKLGLDGNTAYALAQLAGGTVNGLSNAAGAAANYISGWISGNNTQAQQQPLAEQKPAYTSYNANTPSNTTVQQLDPAQVFMMQNNIAPEVMAQLVRAQNQQAQYYQQQVMQPQSQVQTQPVVQVQQKSQQQTQGQTYRPSFTTLRTRNK